MKIKVKVCRIEIDKLNKVIGLDYPDSIVSIITENEEELVLSISSQNIDGVIETLLEDFDSTIIEEFVGR